jgi:histidine triad (HIT) family protein
MDCIFCKIISGEIKSKFPKETENSVSFLDAFPLAKGHVLVIPKKHHQKIQDMSSKENTDLFSLVHEMS